MVNIILHRGSTAKYPGNSLFAIQEGLEREDVQGIEIDIIWSLDLVPYIYHDTNDTETCGLKIQQSLSSQIDEYAKSRFINSSDKNTYNVLRFSKLPSLIMTKKILYLDLKTESIHKKKINNIIKRLKPILNDLSNSEIIVSSFDSRIGEIWKSNYNIPIIKSIDLQKNIKKSITLCKKKIFDGVSINKELLSKNVFNSITSLKIIISCYTFKKSSNIDNDLLTKIDFAICDS